MQRGMGPTIQDLVCSVDLQLEIARKLSLEVQKLVAELERRTELAQESRHIQLYLRCSAGDPTGTKPALKVIIGGADFSISTRECSE